VVSRLSRWLADQDYLRWVKSQPSLMWVELVERVGRCHCPGFVLAKLGYGQIATCGGRQPAEPTEPTEPTTWIYQMTREMGAGLGCGCGGCR
jgi:hypothetical protein